MQKPRLIVMVGLSGSGKSTIAKELAEKHNAQIVSSDAIREELTGDAENQDKNKEVFELFHKRIKEALLLGRDVIADATNLTMKSRKAILQNVAKISCTKEARVVAKDVEECIADNNKRDRIVPEYVIREQCKRFEIPFYEEGFDSIQIVNCSRNLDKEEFFETMTKAYSFDQQNPHHNETLGNHQETAGEAFFEKGYRGHLNWAAKHHDIGKLFTQTFDENACAHYYNHENVGAYFLLTRLQFLYGTIWFGQKELLDMLFLINYHMKPFSWKEPKTHEKYKRIFGEEKYKLLMDFHECDKIRELPTQEKEEQEISEERC